MGSRAPRLSRWGAWVLSPRSMWNLPGPGIKPVSPALACGSLTIGPPGKSRTAFWVLNPSFFQKPWNIHFPRNTQLLNNSLKSWNWFTLRSLCTTNIFARNVCLYLNVTTWLQCSLICDDFSNLWGRDKQFLWGEIMYPEHTNTDGFFETESIHFTNLPSFLWVTWEWRFQFYFHPCCLTLYLS